MTLQIVASLIDAARGIIYDRRMFIVQATGLLFLLSSLSKASSHGRKALQPFFIFFSRILLFVCLSVCLCTYPIQEYNTDTKMFVLNTRNTFVYVCVCVCVGVGVGACVYL